MVKLLAYSSGNLITPAITILDMRYALSDNLLETVICKVIIISHIFANRTISEMISYARIKIIIIFNITNKDYVYT